MTNYISETGEWIVDSVSETGRIQSNSLLELGRWVFSIGANTYNRTYTIDALLQKLNINKTYSIDTLIQKLNISRNYTQDLLLVLAINRTQSIDVLLQKLNIDRNYVIDALIQKLSTDRNITSDILLQKLNIDRNYSIDAFIQKLNIERSVVLDVILNVAAKNYSIDVLVQKLNIDRNIVIDLMLILTIDRNYVLDILIKKLNINRTIVLDLLLSAAYNQTINSISRIYLQNAAEVVKRILMENWDYTNLGTPTIDLLTNVKRIDYHSNDWILIDTLDYDEDYADLFRDFVTTRTKIKLNVMTSESWSKLNILYRQIESIIRSIRKNVGYDNYDVVGTIRKVDKSSGLRKLYSADIEFELKEIVKSVT